MGDLHCAAVELVPHPSVTYPTPLPADPGGPLVMGDLAELLLAMPAADDADEM